MVQTDYSGENVECHYFQVKYIKLVRKTLTLGDCSWMFSTCVALSVSIDKGHKYDTMSVLGFYPAVPVVDTKHRAAISLRILKEKALLCQLNV